MDFQSDMVTTEFKEKMKKTLPHEQGKIMSINLIYIFLFLKKEKEKN